MVSCSLVRAWTEAWNIPLQHGVPVPGWILKLEIVELAKLKTHEVVTVRSHGTDELLVRCPNSWSAGTGDAVSPSGQHLQRTVRLSSQPCPRNPSSPSVYSGPRSWRRKWGCQDPHGVIHCVVLSGFAITSTLFMPDNHMMLVFITNYSSSALDFIFHKLYPWMKEDLKKKDFSSLDRSRLWNIEPRKKNKKQTGRYVEKYAQLLPCLILFRWQWSSFVKLGTV